MGRGCLPNTALEFKGRKVVTGIVRNSDLRRDVLDISTRDWYTRKNLVARTY